MLESIRAASTTKLEVRPLLRFGALLWLTTGCMGSNHASTYDRLGIERDGAGIRIVYLSCPDEVVESIKLYELDDDNVAPDDGDELIWEFNGDLLTKAASEGVIPAHLDKPITLKSEDEYFVDVATAQSGANSDSFRIGDFDDNELLVNRKWMPFAEFVDAAANSCDRN